MDDDDDVSPLRMLLDPRGRIDRRAFWLWGVAAMIGLSLLLRALLDIARVRAESADWIVNAVLAWPVIAVSAKRWHDRGRSAWWVLVALIPVIGWLWMLIDNGCRRGDPGPNRYGPPPVSSAS